VTPDDFIIRRGFVDREELNRYILYNKKTCTATYPLLSDSIFNLTSAFPKLQTIDTLGGELASNNNHYEIEYSYILQILKEPSLYNCENKQAIRIIGYSGNQIFCNRVEIQDNGVLHVFSCAGFGNGRPLTYSFGRSSLRSKRSEKKLKAAINELDFEKEQYFSRLNLDKSYPVERVIIEYRDGDKYYVFRKPRYKKPYRKFVRRIFSF
jgi:hypothetical protein